MDPGSGLSFELSVMGVCAVIAKMHYKYINRIGAEKADCVT
jgi:hypothetical protein